MRIMIGTISSLSDLVLWLCFKGCFTSLYISKGEERSCTKKNKKDTVNGPKIYKIL